MPTKWTPELDSILLHGVFEEVGISFSKALCTKISERVQATGVECTPKAIENRLYSWKKKNLASTPSSTTAGAPTPAKDASATPTPAKGSAAKAKTGRVRGGGKKATATKQITPESEEPESPSLRGKKRGRTEQDDEEEMSEKKVKVEDLDGEDEEV